MNTVEINYTDNNVVPAIQEILGQRNILAEDVKSISWVFTKITGKLVTIIVCRQDGRAKKFTINAPLRQIITPESSDFMERVTSRNDWFMAQRPSVAFWSSLNGGGTGYDLDGDCWTFENSLFKGALDEN